MTSPVDFGVLLGLAYQVFVDELQIDLRVRGFDDIGTAYGYVFRALDAEELHLRQLAERLGMSDQGAAKIVNEMEQRGYLERHPDPVDGRIKKLRLSSRGAKALATARRFHAAYVRRLGKSLSEDDLAATRRVLEAVVASHGTDAAHARLRAM
ncbi:MAG: MarR family transcriptional regulator [Rhodoferax sp.]|nr:MarR family transcriptional regulator [Rhodoferax sp.]MBP9930457.1 MarR family transcriptional regulator [Rhodoferax sp.]HQX59233.1 MarR family transcriptional regulator [Burkholderiaceae bacterium]HQZ08179.1 MarR family transcriptional regulator [Burkholderiaceae bacterium]HRA64281.1 MarR family transcriptional regulator [Burkholderiaceae bacterium]